jgi:prophage antirepressor-like protein
MAGNEPKAGEPKAWEQHLRDGAARAEEELRRVVTYINDEVVPDIRKNGSQALRAASDELQKLAQRMDDRNATASGQAETRKDETKP